LGGGSAIPCASPPTQPYIFPIIHFGYTTLLTGMTGISLHLQWPLTPQSHGSFTQREPLFFVRDRTQRLYKVQIIFPLRKFNYILKGRVTLHCSTSLCTCAPTYVGATMYKATMNWLGQFLYSYSEANSITKKFKIGNYVMEYVFNKPMSMWIYQD
jgi:hypothetical protein